ncbi:hypothetical protein [Nonomuraea glycinis]|uniref:hypothetical protein n=1 Tax=Nonomuraea glycinis TaxID=2047744 RepID=UPI0033B35385
MTDLGDLADPYDGVHPTAPQVGYELIFWREPDPRSYRVRGRDHTCATRRAAHRCPRPLNGAAPLNVLLRNHERTAVMA